MSAPDLTPAMMRRFVASGAENHLTFLLGAGASTSSGLPDWDELAVRMLIESQAVPDREAAELLVRRQDPLIVAEATRKHRDSEWDRMVQRALYQEGLGPTPSALHLATAAHALSGDGTDTTLITLNFDVLLEDALGLGTDLPVDSRVDDQFGAGRYVVHHLHGIVSPDQVCSPVLTLSDFNELLGDSSSWQLALLRRAVRRGGVVIAGTSYRDPDLRRWLHVARADQPDGHAAIVLLTRQGFGLSRSDFQRVEEALSNQWRAVGLDPVILEDFADAAQIVRELRSVHDSGYKSPQERAREVWDAHATAFDELQVGYSDQLAFDAELLRAVLDVGNLNVTLWLADGHGRIARWASQDRRYRSVASLQRVDSGHDSGWVAGRALGSETLLFQNLKPGEARRWSTVLAVPVAVEHSGLPKFVSAVVSVGLPGSAEDYGQAESPWLDTILDLANDWGVRLSNLLTDL